MVRNLEKVLQWNEKTSGEMDLLIEWLTTTEDKKIMEESEMIITYLLQKLHEEPVIM